MTYSEELKDPRWQKKRLKVMDRDKWKCTECGNYKITLHVHHEKYHDNPWDTPMKYLKTLCEECHKDKHGDEKLKKLLDDIYKEQSKNEYDMDKLHERCRYLWNSFLISRYIETDLDINNYGCKLFMDFVKKSKLKIIKIEDSEK